MKDEYGFDPDETYTQEDNLFWDGTNFAHPAWWRGQDDGIKGAARRILKEIYNKDHRCADEAVREVVSLCERWLGGGWLE